MIALASDCLLVTTSNGESIPYSADMLSVELAGDANQLFEEDFVRHAADAVFHYFKNEMGVSSVSLTEFATALEKVLRGFAVTARVSSGETPVVRRIVEYDLSRLAQESGEGRELVFFPKLRAELRGQLQEPPTVLRFRGLRDCVKLLVGARRWGNRCQSLEAQIVDYVRECLSAEPQGKDLAVVVE